MVFLYVVGQNAHDFHIIDDLMNDCGEIEFIRCNLKLVYVNSLFIVNKQRIII